MLITDPEGEQFWPGQSQKLFGALSGPKTLLKFTRAEGGDLQCEPKAQVCDRSEFSTGLIRFLEEPLEYRAKLRFGLRYLD